MPSIARRDRLPIGDAGSSVRQSTTADLAGFPSDEGHQTESSHRPYDHRHPHTDLEVETHLDPGSIAIDNSGPTDGFSIEENRHSIVYDLEALGILNTIESEWLFNQ